MDDAEGPLRGPDRGADPGRHHLRRRRLPRRLHGRRAEARDGQDHGRAPADPGAGQPGPGDPAGRRQGGAPDCIIATGRSDYPNQVNNVLCFPFIFRGALDVGATEINEEMKLACVRALAELARAEQSDVVAAAYGRREIQFGPDYLIPLPFDPRLITTVAPAVAEAAMRSGVATRPLADLAAYRRELQRLRLHLRHRDAAGLRRGRGGARRDVSPTPRARTTACCARPRSWSTSASRARSWSVGPRRSPRGSRSWASASSPAATSRSPASTTRRSSDRRPRSTTASAADGAWSATSRPPRCGATAR